MAEIGPELRRDDENCGIPGVSRSLVKYDQLIAQITDDNRHPEIGVGPAMGEDFG
jgi:hypothetical protein